MKLNIFGAAVALAVLLSGCSPQPQEASNHGELAPSDSVVKINSTSEKCNFIEHGSGFVVADGKIMTNAHVVAAGNKIELIAVDGKHTGQVIYFDPQNDLAILSVAGLKLPALAFGEELLDGTKVTLNGFPLAKTFIATEATKTRTVSWKASDIYGGGGFSQKLYELQAAISHGNSGGPVLDDAGLVRGVVLGKASETKAYAITVEQAAAAVAAGEQSKIVNTKCLPK